jgi:hypothetical protein
MEELCVGCEVRTKSLYIILYVGAALAYVMKAVFWGIEVERFARNLNLNTKFRHMLGLMVTHIYLDKEDMLQLLIARKRITSK